MFMEELLRMIHPADAFSALPVGIGRDIYIETDMYIYIVWHVQIYLVEQKEWMHLHRHMKRTQIDMVWRVDIIQMLAVSFLAGSELFGVYVYAQVRTPEKIWLHFLENGLAGTFHCNLPCYLLVMFI